METPAASPSLPTPAQTRLRQSRDAASRFFSDAEREVDTAEDGLTPNHRASLQAALTERDAIITLLARGDPAGAERTTTMYVAYRAAVPR